MSSMFSNNVVAVANGVAAGWGNVGSGFTQLVMPLIYSFLINTVNLSSSTAWRFAFSVPAFFQTVTALMVLAFGQDLPDGKYKRSSNITGEISKENAFTILLNGLKNYRGWILGLTYGFCFGVELTTDNIIAQYFYERFNLDIKTAGAIAASFGLANIVSRPAGGLVSDEMGRRFGMRGRLWSLWVVQTVAGLLCFLLGRSNSLWGSVLVMCCFSFFVQAASGLTFGVVPFVSKRYISWINLRHDRKWGKRPVLIRCCQEKLEQNMNYYELLGVSIDSSPEEIKSSYRKLQKKYHPDIAGEKGHESALLLNKAYRVLVKDDLRKEYDASIGRIAVGAAGTVPTGAFGSVWKGPMRDQALFVDENVCIGCRECVHYASNTFVMDESLGTAHVKVQFGDDDVRIETSVDSCPVNCIHWVDAEELRVLEYLIQPQPKPGYGIYGQGWERPANVFMAAKYFNKQSMEQEKKQKYAQRTKEEETPAQARARESAYMELKNGNFARFWSWMKKSIGH
ncbi:hypothetical protein RD792_016594 [Penstemon davidsonii]|uniref:J domain-containing protein n=1 Tax=Penstemon davidsonii TaxID=160366 RepID=A0ABR0CLG2_9LAMI|nr:hypothetical protein RD792_016594 [Penstemon davidsonii]